DSVTASADADVVCARNTKSCVAVAPAGSARLLSLGTENVLGVAEKPATYVSPLVPTMRLTGTRSAGGEPVGNAKIDGLASVVLVARSIAETATPCPPDTD